MAKPVYLNQLMEQAELQHREGRFGDAEALYNQILKLDKKNATALSLLGALYLQSHHPNRALPILEKANKVRPNNPEILNNLGAAYFQSSQFEKALNYFTISLKARPHYLDALNNLGSTCLQLKRTDEAIAYFSEALRLHPNHEQASMNLGHALQELGQHPEAATQFEGVLRRNPQHLDALFHLGMLLRSMGRMSDAITLYERAAERMPQNAPVLNNLGNLLRESGRFSEAVSCYERALVLKPDYAEAYINIGTVKRDLNEGDVAKSHYEKALALAPNSPIAHINMGSLYHNLNQNDQALHYYNTALKIDPHSIDAQWNKGLLLLSRGDYAEGWKLHEVGLGYQEKRGPHSFTSKRWKGENLTGKRLLIAAEQGLGDTLQFIRYAALCKQQGAYVLVQCPSPLVRILCTHPSVDQVVTAATLDDFDYYIPMMSLPFMFGTTLETILNQVPYLSVTPEYQMKWASRMSQNLGLKIGLVWSGNPRENLIHAHLVDKRRSIGLAPLMPLLSIQGTQFYSLQAGKASVQIDMLDARSRIIDFMDDVGDFMDTAAIMKNLDIIISVDTSVVHLAGALALPVWVLSRFDACWRWLGNRSSNPWYPTARVFGQSKPGDWGSVVAEIDKAIRAQIASAS